MTIIGGLTWHSTARNICTCAVFATTSFNFDLSTYFVSHYWTLHAVFNGRVVEQSCLNVVWKMRCQRSHICWCVLTPCFCFASSVSFASFKKLILSSQRLVSLSFKKTTIHINLLEYFFLRLMFAFIPLFVDFVRYLTFWHHMIQIQILKHKVYRDYFMESACVRDFHMNWWSIWNRMSEHSERVRFLIQNQRVWKFHTKRFPCSNLFISYILRFLLFIQL